MSDHTGCTSHARATGPAPEAGRAARTGRAGHTTGTGHAGRPDDSDHLGRSADLAGDADPDDLAASAADSDPADPAGPAGGAAPTGGAKGPGAADWSVVIPTLGRDCLTDCLTALADNVGPLPSEVVLVDDRPQPLPLREGLPLHTLGPLRDRTREVQCGGRGPAAARNLGWQSVQTRWVVFLDDDVRVSDDWSEQLVRDLAEVPEDTAGVQGVLEVPLPEDRPPTDWERTTAELQRARWITADMAYRTDALKSVDGFDERFRRAFREDVDLALRLLDAGWRIRRGKRRSEHPVRPTDRWVSLRAQAGNADDALMLRLHGTTWWRRAAAQRGRIRRHTAVTAAGVSALALAAAGRGRAAATAAALWALGTGEFAADRISPGPRDRDEVLTMLVTSVLIPPLAVWHRVYGTVRHRGALPWKGGR